MQPHREVLDAWTKASQVALAVRLGPSDARVLRDMRLAALRSDAACFGSNYAREENFEVEEWTRRLARMYFVVLCDDSTGIDVATAAVRFRDGTSSVTFVDPKDPLPSATSSGGTSMTYRLAAMVGIIPSSLIAGGGEQPDSTKDIVVSVWTVPWARGNGLIPRLLRCALAHHSAMIPERRVYVLDVFADNTAARLCFERAGFVVSDTHVSPGCGDDPNRQSLRMIHQSCERTGTSADASGTSVTR
jgi:hypothetical protein